MFWGGSGDAEPAEAAAGAAAAAPGVLRRPSEPAPFSLLQQLAGWLSPGVTVALEGTLGAMAPFGRDAERPNGIRLADRFFLSSSRMRGFDAVGPVAPRLPHGSPYGDAIGGDAFAHVTARLLLPPPIPSVRMANAGLRTHLFASAGRVGAVEQLSRPSDFLRGMSASAGVGLVSAGGGVSACCSGGPDFG